MDTVMALMLTGRRVVGVPLALRHHAQVLGSAEKGKLNYQTGISGSWCPLDVARCQVLLVVHWKNRNLGANLIRIFRYCHLTAGIIGGAFPAIDTTAVTPW